MDENFDDHFEKKEGFLGPLLKLGFLFFLGLLTALSLFALVAYLVI